MEWNRDWNGECDAWLAKDLITHKVMSLLGKLELSSTYALY